MGARILARRRDLGLTQKQMAERIGVPAPTLSRWEKGHHRPDTEWLLRLARALDVDVVWLLESLEPQASLLATEVA